jgi:hypothetical protein
LSSEGSGPFAKLLGAILLLLSAVSRNKAKPESAPGLAGKHRIKNARRVSAKESIASEPAVIANLYSQGALTPEEFVAAKRRVPGI